MRAIPARFIRTGVACALLGAVLGSTVVWGSPAGQVTLLGAPAITSDPQSLTVQVGGTATFAVTATGAQEFQWYRIDPATGQGKPIAGANAATYGFQVTASDHGAQFYVMVANAEGYVASAVATLSVGASLAPSITQHPQDVSAQADTIVAFSVRATGSDPLEYQWYRIDPGTGQASPVTGAVSADHAFRGAGTDHGARYYAMVSNGAGYVASAIATLKVTFPTVIVSPVSPGRGVMPFGGARAFSATATGGATNGLIWSVDGIRGGNAAVGSINGAGLYSAPATGPSRTNLCAHSDAFETWSPLVAGTAQDPAVTPNNAQAPDESITADTVTFNVGSGASSGDYSFLLANLPSVGVGSPYTASVWIKGAPGQQVVLRGVAETAYILVTCTGKWERLSTTETAFAPTGRFAVGLRQGVPWNLPSTATVQLWRGQVEAGTEATAGIPTTTSPVTTTDAIHLIAVNSLDDPSKAASASVTVTNSAEATPTATTHSGAKALRIWHKGGTNSSVSRYLGKFEAGDVVTATVWFKAPVGNWGSVFLGDAGGADPYDNKIYAEKQGNGDWQSITVTWTLRHRDDMWLYLYGDNANPAPSDANSILYDDAVVSSVQRGTVLAEGFEAGLARASLYPDMGADGWDLDVQPTDVVTASTAATYNGAKAARVWYKDGVNAALMRYVGRFEAGDVVSVRVNVKGRPGLGSSVLLRTPDGSAPDYQWVAQTFECNGAWQSAQASLTMSHADDVWVFLHGAGSYSDGLLYDDVAVSSVRQGRLWFEGFEVGLRLTSSWSDRSGAWISGGQPNDLVTSATNLDLPVIFGFTANPASLSFGQSTTLNWEARCALPLNLSLDGGIGNVASAGIRVVSPPASTTYTLTATSAAGSAAQAVPVSVLPPDTQAPTLTVAASGSSGTITLSAAAADNVAVTKVEFYVNDKLKATVTSAPWSMPFDTTTLMNGPSLLSAKAYDAAGNVGSAQAWFSVNNVDTTAPTVTVSVAGTSGTLTLAHTATDNVAVRNSDYFVDGVAIGGTGASQDSKPFDSKTLADGPHTFLVKAYDVAGNVGTASTTFTVDNRDYTPPVVSVAIRSQTRLAILFGATPSDNVGVAAVDFYVDGVLKETATAAPWTFGIEYTQLPQGTRTLVAKARDAAGNVGSSAGLSFLVDSEPPTVSVSVAGASPQFVFQAVAKDNLGVQRVEFHVDGSLRGSLIVPPYNLPWDTGGMSQGTHLLEVRAYDRVGHAATSQVTFLVSDPGIQVKVSPEAATLAPGGTLAFTGTLTGSSFTGLSWTATGGSISDSGLFTAPTLPGTYTITARSAQDPSRLAQATVLVLGEQAPAITAQPQGKTVSVGQRAIFTVTASGFGPLRYQWKKNSQNIEGATENSYTTPPVAMADHGALYSVTVNNQYGGVASTSALLSVSDGSLSVTVSPADQEILPGATVALTATVAGTTNQACDWTTTGGALSSNNGSTVTWKAPAMAGTYTVTASSQADPTCSGRTTLRVRPCAL